MSTLKIVGVDVGSKTNGFALVTVDLKTFKIVDIETTLIDVSDIADKSLFKNHLYVRLNVLTKRTRSLMEVYQPDIVSIEAPFMNRLRPGSFGPLTKAVYAITMGIHEYDHLLQIEEFAPKVSKKLIGVKNIDKKATTLEALSLDKTITDLINLHNISEHEVDAISLAYPIIEKFRNMQILPFK